jgi:hexosaminidase
LLCVGVAHAQINVVPEPQHVVEEQGAFTLRQDQRVVAPADPRAQWIAQFLRDKIKQQTGVALRVAAAPAYGMITLKLDPSIKGDEAYRLDVSPRHIVLAAKDERGLFWGVQTLRQLLPLQHEVRPAISSVRIEDAPRYRWRGVMLDVARH